MSDGPAWPDEERKTVRTFARRMVKALLPHLTGDELEKATLAAMRDPEGWVAHWRGLP